MSTPGYTRQNIAGFTHVEAHADGEVTIEYDYYDSEGNQYTDDMTFTVDELQKIIMEANAHKKAYACFKESGYENSAGYDRTMLFLCGKK